MTLTRYNTGRMRDVALAILFIIAASLTAEGRGSVAGAGEPLRERQARVAADSITAGYETWTTLLLDGKLRTDGLPVSPSLRVFMDYGRKLMISVRAPLLGEVGRIEVDTDTVLLVNKMKKVYAKEALSDLPANIPAGLRDIQCLLLGRVAVGGEGELDRDNFHLADFYPDAGGGWIVVPKEKVQPEGAAYGFVVDADGYLEAFMLTVPGGTDTATILYSYPGDGIDLMVDLKMGKRQTIVDMELDKPRWGASPFDSIKINSKYRKTDINGFFKSF